MSKIILVTGGARSGKSTFAQNKAMELSRNVCYIATAKNTDKDMDDRIKKHKKSRPNHWYTIEKYNDFLGIQKYQEFKDADIILLDCITVLVTNNMFDYEIDYDNCSIELVEEIEKNIINEINSLIDIILYKNKQIIFVTNEVGMGLVSPYRLGNLFRDIAGRVNQMIAQRADEVYFLVSSISMRIK